MCTALPRHLRLPYLRRLGKAAETRKHTAFGYCGLRPQRGDPRVRSNVARSSLNGLIGVSCLVLCLSSPRRESDTQGPRTSAAASDYCKHTGLVFGLKYQTAPAISLCPYGHILGIKKCFLSSHGEHSGSNPTTPRGAGCSHYHQWFKVVFRQTRAIPLSPRGILVNDVATLDLKPASHRRTLGRYFSYEYRPH